MITPQIQLLNMRWSRANRPPGRSASNLSVTLLISILVSSCSPHTQLDAVVSASNLPASTPSTAPPLENKPTKNQQVGSEEPASMGLSSEEATNKNWTESLDDDEFDDLSAEYEIEDKAKWQERAFSGNTRYTFSGLDDGTIKGESDGTASLLYRQQDIDVAHSPWLNWRWKITNTYGNLNEKTRDGDDYPARFYVVVQTGALPWDTKAINYVWSSNGAVGDSWNNPFTENAKMLVLQAGDQRAGEWITEKRDVVADFKTLFDLEINKLSGYAVMVDGDNSGSSGTGWFSDIYFSQE